MITLVKETDGEYDLCLPLAVNPYTDAVYDSKTAETVLVFTVCALAQIGKTNNNLIGVCTLLIIFVLNVIYLI